MVWTRHSNKSSNAVWGWQHHMHLINSRGINRSQHNNDAKRSRSVTWKEYQSHFIKKILLGAANNTNQVGIKAAPAYMTTGACV